MSLEFVFKQPSEVLDYDVDFTEWFQSSPGDDIEAVVANITGDDNALALVGTRPPAGFGFPDGAPHRYAKVWLEGGTDGVTYKVTVRVTTEGGRVKEFDFEVRVKED